MTPCRPAPPAGAAAGPGGGGAVGAGTGGGTATPDGAGAGVGGVGAGAEGAGAAAGADVGPAGRVDAPGVATCVFGIDTGGSCSPAPPSQAGIFPAQPAGIAVAANRSSPVQMRMRMPFPTCGPAPKPATR